MNHPHHIPSISRSLRGRLHLPASDVSLQPAYHDGHDIAALHILKVFCAFGVVQLHTTSFFAADTVPLCRLAVPLFFMITGYFLINREGQLTMKRLRSTFWKILQITVATNLFYYAYRVIDGWCRHDVLSSLLLTPKEVVQLLLLGNVLCGPLWYMTALLEALAVLMLLVKLRRLRWMPAVAALGLLANFCVGEFRLLGPLEGYCLRNFVFLSLPFLYIGMVVRLNEHRLRLSSRRLMAVALAVVVLLYAEYFSLWHFYATDTVQGDVLLFTVVLTVTLFLWALKTPLHYPRLVTIGRRHSTNIYLFHPFVATLLELPAVRSILPTIPAIASIELFVLTLLFSVALQRGKKALTGVVGILR
jgi:surface polysaccharide O-acyltransferase-like enzyme